MVEIGQRLPLGVLSSRDHFFRLRDDRAAMLVGATLAAMVAVLAAAHVATSQIILHSGTHEGLAGKIFFFVNLESERSLSEAFNHGMLFAVALMFLGVSYAVVARTPFLLGVFFGFAWLDDSAQYHERMGRFLVERLEVPSAFGLRGQDFGELLAWGLAGALLLPLALWSFMGRRRGDGTVLRMVAWPLGGLLFCVVIFDMIHIVVETPLARLILTVLEDGGEMLFMAIVVAVAIAVLRNCHEVYEEPR